MQAGQIRRTYSWMSHVYDLAFRRLYAGMRRQSIDQLALQPGDTVVLVGAGTGLDIPLLPPVSWTVAIDLSDAMLHRATRLRSSSPVYFILAEGTAVPLRDSTVSAVTLHLVLSVAPDPHAVLKEAARILRPGGKAAIVDHFAPPGRPGLLRRLLARIPHIIGTHVDRRFEDAAAGLPFRVLSDRLLVRGWYRAIVLERTTGRCG